MFNAVVKNFLGNAPIWYKLAIIVFLIINPILLITSGPFITGWVLIGEFIFTLAMALKCYPLPSGGLLAIEAIIMGMAKPETVYHEALANFEVILLLMFMVAGIYFMKEFLQFTFTRILVQVQSKVIISLLFCFAGAFLSAFLDALTVTAVIIAVAFGFYNVYHRYVSGKGSTGDHDLTNDQAVKDAEREDLVQFRGFLRNLMMHGAVGTALGGVCTLVGEPQNLLIGSQMGWHFVEFFLEVAPVSIPVLFVGLGTCYALEKKHWFGYGVELPGNIRSHLLETAVKMEEQGGTKLKARLIIQAVGGIWLILALAFHLAAVGLIGLSVIIFLTSMNGITDEHQFGHAFTEAPALYRTAGCIFLHCCGDSRTAPVPPHHAFCSQPPWSPAAWCILHCQRFTLRNLRQRICCNRIYYGNKNAFCPDARPDPPYRHDRQRIDGQN